MIQTERKAGGRLGIVGMVVMISWLCDEPLSAIELGTRANLSANRSRVFVNRLHETGWAHIAEWWRPVWAKRSIMVPRFRFGPGDDAPSPYPERKRKPRKETNCPELMHCLQIVKNLREPITVNDLADATGGDRCHTRKVTLELYRRGIIHIGDYAPRGVSGQPSRMYVWGKGKDAKRPEPIPRKVLEQRRGEQLKQRRAQARLLKALASNQSIFREAA